MGRLLLFLVRVDCFRELQGNGESHVNEECFLGEHLVSFHSRNFEYFSEYVDSLDVIFYVIRD